MRICIASTIFHAPWGGSEVLWARLAREALDRGHQVALVVKRWPETPAPVRDLEARGAKVFFRTVDLSRRRSRAYEYLVHPFPAIARWKPDVLVISQGGLYDLVYRRDMHRLIERTGAPYVPIMHQAYDGQFPIWGEGARESILTYCRGARRVAFVAEGNRRAAERQLATALPNGVVVRNPTNLAGDGLVPWPSGGPARLACVARLEVNDKGQDALFECLAGEPWRHRDWELRLYGRGQDQPYLERLARHYGIADRVRFRGLVGEVEAIWRDNHLLILPSRVEGTPLALVEAMLCGRPAVVTDVGGHAEWVSEPRNGFLAEVASVRSFGAALERAWAARADWEAIGRTAREDALGLVDPAPARTLLEIVTAADLGATAGLPAGARS